MRSKGLKKAIQAAGSVSELARRLGISQPSVSNWERVPAERVLSIEAATGVDRNVLRPDLFQYQRLETTGGRSSPVPVKQLFAKRDKPVMNEDTFNMSLRKFLKQVGVTSQRAIETFVREHSLGKGKLKVRMVLTAPGTDLNHVIEEDLDLG